MGQQGMPEVCQRGVLIPDKRLLLRSSMEAGPGDPITPLASLQDASLIWRCARLTRGAVVETPLPLATRCDPSGIGGM